MERTSVPFSLYQKVVTQEEKLPEDFMFTESIKSIYQIAERAALTDEIPVLISGENGTGKEHLARYIHNHSVRKEKPFIAVNCSALTDSLLESRLFGYLKGSHSTAFKNTPGFFEAADGGTLFLDEIGDTSAFMQQSLLRVLQEKEIVPVGGNTPKKINVRIICATNKDLQKMVSEGKFREDLFYRIAGAELELLPLRMRGEEEIKEYLKYYIVRCKPSGQNVFKLSPAAEEYLLNYSYPGNIRELINIVYKLYLLQKETIEINDLPQKILEKTSIVNSWKIQDIEKAHIIKAMHFFEGNKKKVAEEIGISYTSLHNKIKEYKIDWIS